VKRTFVNPRQWRAFSIYGALCLWTLVGIGHSDWAHGAIQFSPFENLTAYQAHYHLPKSGEFRFITVKDYQIAQLVWEPSLNSSGTEADSIKGTVIFLHGYLDHLGLYSELYRELLKAKYKVVAVDLPGHGLSSGKPGDVHSMADYGDLVSALISQHGSDLADHQSLVLMGHSTGCLAIQDYLYRNPNHPELSAVFVAPLVRSAQWGWSTFFYRLAGGSMKEIPKWDRANSSDPEFVARLHQDPLRVGNIPGHWFSELIHWNQHQLQHAPVQTKVPLLILQGNKDKVVAWKKNLKILKGLFPQAEIEMVPNGQHHLLNENPTIKTKVYDRLFNTLNAQ